MSGCVDNHNDEEFFASPVQKNHSPFIILNEVKWIDVSWM